MVLLKLVQKTYQIYNMIGKEKNPNNIIPLMYILMSHKSYTLYFVIFNYI